MIKDVYDLRKKMPQYFYKRDGQFFQISGFPDTKNINPSTFQDDPISEWVKQRHEDGKLGEQIAKIYLQRNFKKVIRASKDGYGYDFQADNQFFEIKTSTSKQDVFIITVNKS